MKIVLYLDMWVGERIQEMKLAGIRRFAQMAEWEVVPVGEKDSRPRKLRALLKRYRPDGVIVECSAARTDLPPRLFGKVPVVYLDSSRTLYGAGVARSVHDYKLTLKTAMRELSSNRPACYAFVEYREKRVWSVFRRRGFADQGGDSTKWDHCVELGTVAAGATSFAATLPAASSSGAERTTTSSRLPRLRRLRRTWSRSACPCGFVSTSMRLNGSSCRRTVRMGRKQAGSVWFGYHPVGKGRFYRVGGFYPPPELLLKLVRKELARVD